MTLEDQETKVRAAERAAKSWFGWSEVHASWDSGCVVHLPHTADRLDIGLEIARTEYGHDAAWNAGDVTITPTWGRLLTLRDQWEYVHDTRGVPTPEGPPLRWYPDEGVPAWVRCPPGEGDEIWLCEEATTG